MGISDVIDRRDGVLARHEPEQIVAVGLLHGRVEPAQFGVQLADRGRGGRAVGAKLLGGVVEVRQVDPEEVGRPSPRRNRGRSGDPGRGTDVGQRPPEMLQGEMAQLVAQLAVKLRRPRVTPQRLRAVGIMDRLGRAEIIGLRADAVHGKPHGRSQGPFHVRKQVPDLRPLDAIVGRGPHLDLLLLPPIEPIGHHAVGRRQPARGHVGLHRAGHAGEARHEVDDLARRSHLAKLRHDGDVFFTQAGRW